MLDVGTLRKSAGRLSPGFLRGCGLSGWETLFARLYDATLTPAEIDRLQSEIFSQRSKGFFVGSVFISYSRADAPFADHVRQRLGQEGASVYVDDHNMVAGNVEKQLREAIGRSDIFLLILSKASLQSDWVEAELEWARAKEKAEDRDLLCPVAVDESWKTKTHESALWRQVNKKHVLNFSHWNDATQFETEFKKLLHGMKIHSDVPKE